MAKVRLTKLASHAATAGGALIIHAALTGLAILTVYGTEQLIHYLWGQDDPLLFDRVPYRWLFQSIESVIILLFGGMGIRDAFLILRDDS